MKILVAAAFDRANTVIGFGKLLLDSQGVHTYKTVLVLLHITQHREGTVASLDPLLFRFKFVHFPFHIFTNSVSPPEF